MVMTNQGANAAAKAYPPWLRLRTLGYVLTGCLLAVLGRLQLRSVGSQWLAVTDVALREAKTMSNVSSSSKTANNGTLPIHENGGGAAIEPPSSAGAATNGVRMDPLGTVPANTTGDATNANTTGIVKGDDDDEHKVTEDLPPDGPTVQRPSSSPVKQEESTLRVLGSLTEVTTVKSDANGTLWIPDAPDERPRETLLIAFTNTTIKESDVLGDCPITAQLSLDTSSSSIAPWPPTDASSSLAEEQQQYQQQEERLVWTIHTHDIEGRPKTVGGDEFYVSYYDKLDARYLLAASNTTDHGNGTYSLDFITSPMLERSPADIPARGVLVVWLEYTCGIGSLERPHRAAWSTGGATVTNWTVADVPRPPIRVFQRPPVPLDFGRAGAVAFSWSFVARANINFVT